MYKQAVKPIWKTYLTSKLPCPQNSYEFTKELISCLTQRSFLTVSHARVSSLYGPGSWTGWACTALSVIISWTFHTETCRIDTITNDYLAILAVLAIAAGHTFGSSPTMTRSTSDNTSATQYGAGDFRPGCESVPGRGRSAIVPEYGIHVDGTLPGSHGSHETASKTSCLVPLHTASRLLSPVSHILMVH